MATGDDDNDNGNGAMGECLTGNDTMMIATSKDDNDDDGDGATGDEVDDDGDSVTGDGATGYDNINDDGLALLATKFTERHNNQDAHPYF